MLVKNILAGKGHTVHTIAPDATLDDGVAALVQHNVGSLLVCSSQHQQPAERELTGIITERDVLRAHAAKNGQLAGLRVRDIMSTDLVTASPEDRVESAMALMTDRRVRHLPVVADGRLLGIISIGDVVKRLCDHLTMENHYMKSYILGESVEVSVQRFAP